MLDYMEELDSQGVDNNPKHPDCVSMELMKDIVKAFSSASYR